LGDFFTETSVGRVATHLAHSTGTGETVKNLAYLTSINVTHVLNTAECDVNVNPKRYTKEGICYKGFRVNDVPHADISQVRA
jgi:hypothetical protein